MGSTLVMERGLNLKKKKIIDSVMIIIYKVFLLTWVFGSACAHLD
jgi:hypothetical protein